VFKEDWTRNEEHPMQYTKNKDSINRLQRVEPIRVTKKTKKNNEHKEKKEEFLIYSTFAFVQHDEFARLPLVIDYEIMK